MAKMVERWNPAAEMDRVLNEMDRFLFQAVPRARMIGRGLGFTPSIDLVDTGDHLVVKALIPGAHADNIDVSLEQNVLSISGRYGYTFDPEESKHYTWYRREIGQGQFAESVTLPVPVDAEHVEATFEDGILTLTLPKAEQARAKRIAVQAPQALTSYTS